MAAANCIDRMVAAGLGLLAVSSGATATASVYKYNVCNGLSNQLLYHASSIATAIREGYQQVYIPDYFIVDGVQSTDDAVLPSSDNSIAFEIAFDARYFLERVTELGIQPRLVKYDDDQPDCQGLTALATADPDVVLQVLKAFRPSVIVSYFVAKISSNIRKSTDLNSDEGVCVHHRAGQDWQDHCDRWSSIQDGIYRGNCLGTEPLTDSLKSRGVDQDKNWIYYCGDDEALPDDLRQSSYEVMSRHTLLTLEDKEAIEAIKPDSSLRDLWALIDFSVCGNVPGFVGNSVSTFSALQIALRQGDKAYWYNSQSIPLAEFWNVYNVPIVYTYTELSEATGKRMLRASIASVRQHMPATKIHILYHGTTDVEFQNWLLAQGVTIHAHDPAWKDSIEQMRQHGDASLSHLFSHAGNYFGTWQRIDIPLFIEHEYVLLLDADTVVIQPFSLPDFGQDLTTTLAMSSEIDITDEPINAGVILMNVPHMRRTYQDFLAFIEGHTHSPQFNNSSPSDQGAYLEFYDGATFLSRCFNFKPYYQLSDIECQEPFIVQFHGAKPNDYLKHILGESCGEATRSLCNRASVMPSLCTSFQVFARSSFAIDKDAYCMESFPSSEVDAEFCSDLMESLASSKSTCTSLTTVIRELVSGANADPVAKRFEYAAVNAERKLQISEAPSAAPFLSCGVEKAPCTSKGDCCSMLNCFGRMPSMMKCATCAKKMENCRMSGDCCDFPTKTKCDMAKMICSKCSGSGGMCGSPANCCKGMCMSGMCS